MRYRSVRQSGLGLGSGDQGLSMSSIKNRKVRNRVIDKDVRREMSIFYIVTNALKAFIGAASMVDGRLGCALEIQTCLVCR
jgi:hypothetical protein